MTSAVHHEEQSWCTVVPLTPSWFLRIWVQVGSAHFCSQVFSPHCQLQRVRVSILVNISKSLTCQIVERKWHLELLVPKLGHLCIKNTSSKSKSTKQEGRSSLELWIQPARPGLLHFEKSTEGGKLGWEIRLKSKTQFAQWGVLILKTEYDLICEQRSQSSPTRSFVCS